MRLPIALIQRAQIGKLASVTTYTSPLDSAQAARLRQLLEDQGFDFESRPHALFAARKGRLNVTVYHKGPKVLVQGAGTEEFVRFTLEPGVLGEARLGYEEIHEPEKFTPHFGIDESGKGDFFGPLVVAGVFTDADVTRRLLDAGVMDSKRVTSAARIRQLAAGIRALPGCASEVVSIGPERYNTMYPSFGNLNRMLAWGHARVIEKLAAKRPDCPRALSDQFARPDVLQRALREKSLRITLEQRTKAESDPAVAAASILARERFIDWLEKTSAACGVNLPPGASDAVLQAARGFIASHGADALGKVAKLHFRTAARLMEGPDSGH
jgi:ribonuclease HIII